LTLEAPVNGLPQPSRFSKAGYHNLESESSQLASYTYTLGAAGNRLTVAELSGRNVVYSYDSLYRLSSETVSADPHSKNGAINYTYDNVGNRLTLNSTLPPAGGMTYSYDADDLSLKQQRYASPVRPAQR